MSWISRGARPDHQNLGVVLDPDVLVQFDPRHLDAVLQQPDAPRPCYL
jgi:hypothetical protein